MDLGKSGSEPLGVQSSYMLFLKQSHKLHPHLIHYDAFSCLIFGHVR